MIQLNNNTGLDLKKTKYHFLQPVKWKKNENLSFSGWVSNACQGPEEMGIVYQIFLTDIMMSGKQISCSKNAKEFDILKNILYPESVLVEEQFLMEDLHNGFLV